VIGAVADVRNAGCQLDFYGINSLPLGSRIKQHTVLRWHRMGDSCNKAAYDLELGNSAVKHNLRSTRLH
jgi:hypothetical protein